MEKIGSGNTTKDQSLDLDSGSAMSDIAMAQPLVIDGRSLRAFVVLPLIVSFIPLITQLSSIH